MIMSNKFEITSKRPSNKLVQAICRKRLDIPLDKVKSMLGYNIIMIKQLCELTGVRPERISAISLPQMNPKAHKPNFTLTRVYPFSSAEGEGPIFIVRDDQCDQFILECNK